MKPLFMLPVFAAGLSCTHPMPDAAQEILSPLRLESGPGGAVMVIKHGNVVFADAFGMADLEDDIPITQETNFRLASVTKEFTATAVMLLVERRKLSLDQRIGEFFPEIAPAVLPITLHQLLTHSSGIVAYEDLIPDTATVPVLDRDVLRLISTVDSTYFPPGSSYRYSNTAYALLALIIEQTSGVSFAAFLEREIFTPLEMTGTVAFQQGISSVERRAFGYTADPEKPGQYVRTDQSMTSSVLGDGGIYSSILDLRKWIDAIQQRVLLPDTLLRQMLSPHVAIEEGVRWYGLGWYVRIAGNDTVYYHGGSTVGFRTHVLLIPQSSSAVITLFNRSDVQPEHVAWKLAEAYGLLPGSNLQD